MQVQERVSVVPYDRKNNKLHPGDLVMIPCIIKGIDKHSTYINLAVETAEGRYPDGKKDLIQINARQTELLKPLGHSDPDMDVTQALSDSAIQKAHDEQKLANHSLDDPSSIHT